MSGCAHQAALLLADSPEVPPLVLPACLQENPTCPNARGAVSDWVGCRLKIGRHREAKRSPVQVQIRN